MSQTRPLSRACRLNVDNRHTLSYNTVVNIVYNWDSDKNNLLINEQGISFEEVIAVLETGNVLDIIDHPNSKMYSHQKIYVVEINGYAYLVPFVKDGNKIFLKTIIPNRKANKKYLSGSYSTRGDNDE